MPPPAAAASDREAGSSVDPPGARRARTLAVDHPARPSEKGKLRRRMQLPDPPPPVFGARETSSPHGSTRFDLAPCRLARPWPPIVREERSRWNFHRAPKRPPGRRRDRPGVPPRPLAPPGGTSTPVGRRRGRREIGRMHEDGPPGKIVPRNRPGPPPSGATTSALRSLPSRPSQDVERPVVVGRGPTTDLGERWSATCFFAISARPDRGRWFGDHHPTAADRVCQAVRPCECGGPRLPFGSTERCRHGLAAFDDRHARLGEVRTPPPGSRRVDELVCSFHLPLGRAEACSDPCR